MKGKIMSEKLIVFLAVGTVAMGIPIMIMSARYEVAMWKAVPTILMLTISGTAGTFLMYYVENQRFGGLSFYGAVFLVPIVFLVVAPILQVSYGKEMDFCAVGECIMLALMKFHCIIGDCCLGRVLWVLSDGTLIRFPSRLAEMVVAFILFVILYRWAMQGKNHGELYIWYIILYGSSRFVLNIFRESWVTKEMILPFGNIWSLAAVTIGAILMLAVWKKR